MGDGASLKKGGVIMLFWDFSLGTKLHNPLMSLSGTFLRAPKPYAYTEILA
ncbi:hypothetical protein SAMN06265379_10475 [Saccharicrinis carchari]|uniref:Uncharacterized protein n=1 Tax=Saccharicrinis carchari TaxID=1168039 RepID=A0A521D1L8_SACCC|nr:hypothetical protein SAMN06265379_10475 [Saccharicrinis carchari]